MNFELNSKTVFSIIVIAFVSFFFIFTWPNVIEPDNIFHISYADVYRHQGITFTDFDWETNSILGIHKSDIWYGYHLLLVPFVSSNYLLSIQLASFFISVTFLVFLLFFFQKLEVRWPLFWTMFLLLSSSVEIYRIYNLRPQVIVLILTILLSYFLIIDKKRISIFFISCFFAFLEISMIWLPFCILGIDFLANGLVDTYKYKRLKSVIKVYAIDFVVILSGLFVGMLLRPNPVAGLKLFYYQIVYLFYIKFKGVVLPWGLEFYKLDFAYVSAFTCMFAVFFLSVFFYFIQTKEVEETKNRYTRFTLVAGGLFLFIMMFLSARGGDYFMIFTFIAGALVYTANQDFIPESIRKNFTAKALVCISIATIFYSSFLNFAILRYQYGLKVDLYKNAAIFLKDNTDPGSVVSYTFFDDFPGLFLWNRENFYTSHSDPTFQYEYNPELYMKYLCGILKIDKNKDLLSNLFYDKFDMDICPEGEIDVVSVLRDEMNVSYFFVGINKPYSVTKMLIRDKRVDLVYMDDKSLIFKLK